VTDRDAGHGSAEEPLPTLGEVFPWIGERLSNSGGVGVLIADASPLLRIEGTYGTDALTECLDRLAALVREVCGDRLDPQDLVVTGEAGRIEVLTFLFRPKAHSDFYDFELRELDRAMGRALERAANRIFYPYLRATARIGHGHAAVFRNPIFGAGSQVRTAIEQARADADLNMRVDARQQRRDLMNVVLHEKIHSVYEPIVDAKTLTVFGYEALARGPEGTPLASPLALFARAQEQGLVFELDCLCRQQGLEGAIDFPEGTKLFLNIRPSAFHDPSFQPDELCATLERCQLTPSDVVFEISEQESIDNFTTFREAREEYGKLGFQFAMDDTGAGYASFESVLELRPEFIKVDRAFVSGIDEDPARQAILLGFQSIAEKINAKIVGEGLDTLEELQTLARLGIQFGQGWLFGKPHPLRESTR
jgi:EAL domain-containing protein (putative c-di-GMP-specific phosphodiesterase class I)